MTSLKQFDSSRPDFAPYGFTVELWKAAKIARADRHAEIEINYLPSGTITYFYGGRRFEVPGKQLAIFWGALPHQVISFDQVDRYYVITIPLRLAIDWRLPRELLRPLIHGQILSDKPSFNDGELQQFAKWHSDFESGNALRRDAMMLELHARLLRLSVTHCGSSCHSMSGDVSDIAITHASEATFGKRAVDVDAAGHGVVSNRVLMTNSHVKAERMASFIAQNFSRKISIQEIATEVGLHPDYATSLFRKSFGMTMVDLITSYRVTQSQRLLITTSQPIFEVAKSSGFETLSRFNAAFKEFSGTTPRAYRQAMGLHLGLA